MPPLRPVFHRRFPIFGKCQLFVRAIYFFESRPLPITIFVLDAMQNGLGQICVSEIGMADVCF